MTIDGQGTEQNAYHAPYLLSVIFTFPLFYNSNGVQALHGKGKAMGHDRVGDGGRGACRFLEEKHSISDGPSVTAATHYAAQVFRIVRIVRRKKVTKLTLKRKEEEGEDKAKRHEKTALGEKQSQSIVAVAAS